MISCKPREIKVFSDTDRLRLAIWVLLLSSLNKVYIVRSSVNGIKQWYKENKFFDKVIFTLMPAFKDFICSLDCLVSVFVFLVEYFLLIASLTNLLEASIFLLTFDLGSRSLNLTKGL
ncbi:Uncharacterised protein [Chlamydia trachomatis]|nr:Uncharacterised protein [Chlamydia trachomatis]